MVYVSHIKNIGDKVDLERVPRVGEDYLVSLPPKLNHDNDDIESPRKTIFGSFKEYDGDYVILSNAITIPVETRLKQLKVDKANIRQTNALMNFYNDLRERKFPNFELEKRVFITGKFPIPNGIEICLIQYRKKSPDEPRRFC
ncbi:hypothetical protein KAT80_00210 [Candidatus Pacearchaeota archaeon]|nr:hypothetical protein [Candidatus Pacearchaeota archaeon]